MFEGQDELGTRRAHTQYKLSHTFHKHSITSQVGVLAPVRRSDESTRDTTETPTHAESLAAEIDANDGINGYVRTTRDPKMYP